MESISCSPQQASDLTFTYKELEILGNALANAVVFANMYLEEGNMSAYEKKYLQRDVVRFTELDDKIWNHLSEHGIKLIRFASGQ